MDPRTRLLLEGPLVGTLLKLALPNVVVMAVQASIGLIETYFVAKLGLDALAGMAVVFPVLMLLQTISAGAIGGGILSAVARALGSGDRARALDLVWAAVLITVILGVATTAAILAFGSGLYALMGARDGSLAAALTYSTIVFCGATPLWLFNSLAAVIRGTGNMAFPASVVTVGAIVLIPLSPMLIFGLGPLPHLGIAGGAVAVVAYYCVGCLVFGWYLWSGRGVLHVRLRPRAVGWAPVRDILRIGLASAVVSTSTNVTIVMATGLAGLIGPAAVAGYGTGVRLEYLLIPLVFGLGAPMSAMVGTAIGAGLRHRALAVAWTGALMAGVITECIGLAAALLPDQWLRLFGQDSEMIAVGRAYLQIVGPAYGFFGAGLALYFASQGAGRIAWPMSIGIVRVLLAAGGGFVVIRVLGMGDHALFVTLAVAMVLFGLLNAMAIRLGAWSRKERV
jgi:putative MATE family efflux protein